MMTVHFGKFSEAEHLGKERNGLGKAYHSKRLDYDINFPEYFDVMHMKSSQKLIPPEFSDVMIT